MRFGFLLFLSCASFSLGAQCITRDCQKPCLPENSISFYESGHVAVTASALFWQAYEDGLDYALTTTAGRAFVNNQGTVFRPDPEWRWGWKVGLNLQPRCNLDIDVLWTHFFTKNSSSVAVSSTQGLWSVWTYPGANLNPETAASAVWRLHLQVLDFSASSLFSPCRVLSLRPQFGISTAWIRQTMDIDLSGGTTASPFPALVLSDAIDMSNRFWGIGPQLGLQVLWNFPAGISLVGGASGALFYGIFDIEQSETVTTLGSSPTFDLEIVNNHWATVRPELNLLFGLQWDYLFGDAYRMLLQLGWEQRVFFSQNQWMRFTTAGAGNAGVNISPQGDLALQGLTIQALFTF